MAAVNQRRYSRRTGLGFAFAVTVVAALAVVTSVRAGYTLIDNWSANIWWTDPGGGGALALAADTFYGYPGTGDNNKYNTAEHFDYWCDCFTYLAAKSFMTDGDWFPWYETSWDIDPDYANATIGRSDGMHVQGKYQAYPYTGWTTYFQYSPVLPN